MSQETGFPHQAEEFNKLVKRNLKEHWKMFVVEGVLLAVLGVAAIILPQIATLAATLLIGWLLFVGGIFRFVSMLGAKHAPGYWSGLILAVLMVVLGVLLALWPVQGVISITLVLIAYFIAHGIASFIFAFSIRGETGNWVWPSVSGLIDFALAAIIIMGWPGTAAWVLGLLLGINLLFAGIGLIFAALGARSAA